MVFYALFFSIVLPKELQELFLFAVSPFNKKTYDFESDHESYREMKKLLRSLNPCFVFKLISHKTEFTMLI